MAHSPFWKLIEGRDHTTAIGTHEYTTASGTNGTNIPQLLVLLPFWMRSWGSDHTTAISTHEHTTNIDTTLLALMNTPQLLTLPSCMRSVEVGTIPQHTACEALREHTTACEALREQTTACEALREHTTACEALREHTTAIGIQKHTTASGTSGNNTH